jgi:hypothetical protein
MSDTTISIRRAYIAECERFWQEATVKWTHNNVNNTKTLTSVQDAKAYIDTASSIWEIDGTRAGRIFIATLKINCEHVGSSASEHISAEYKAGSQEGTCKYILVVVYNKDGRISVASSYHDIDENLHGSNSVYTVHAADITTNWLKSKAVESMRGTVPTFAMPKIDYQ